VLGVGRGVELLEIDRREAFAREVITPVVAQQRGEVG
jgi:hypothetical protein